MFLLEIQIVSAQQPNRILIHKLTRIRFIIPKEGVMQSRFMVGLLVLQSERLVHVLVNPLIFFSDDPSRYSCRTIRGCRFIGHFSWDADLVAVEVTGLLAAFAVCGCPITDFRQGVVAVVL